MTTTNTTTTDPRVTEITKLLKAVGGSASLADLLKVIRPVDKQADAPAAPPVAPVVTDAQRQAITDLPTVFGKVVTTDARALTDSEAIDLMRERLALDAIENLAKKRKEAIRTMAFNHFDAVNPDEVERDDKGHKLAAAILDVPVTGKAFVREIAQAARFLTVEALEDLVSLGVLPRDDFLAMTRPVRVVDDARVTLLLQRKPEVAPVIEPAISVGTKIARFNVRPIKKA